MNENPPERSESRRSTPESEIPELDALDPRADSRRFDAAVGRIMEAVEPELARRREAADPLVYVSFWWRPVARAAAAIVLVSAGLLLGFDHRTGGPAEPGGERTIGTELGPALGVPEAFTGWMARGEWPDPGELVVTLDGDR